MSLPIPTTCAPMEAESAAAIPEGKNWQYEPKWDGFRCLVFRDGKKVTLKSKAGQDLGRYFPEMVEGLLAIKAQQFVLDGELIVASERRLDFDALLQRIHPAESRIKKLSVETPAMLVAFDLLVDDRGERIDEKDLKDRRKKLNQFAKRYFKKATRVRLSPCTEDFAEAKRWFKRLAGPLDGVIAKRTDRPYEPGERSGAILKIKNLRTADCVVGGFRYGTNSKEVASLLLGLYDREGKLNHVGFTSGLANVDKKALTKKLEAIEESPGFTGKKPGGPSRWSKLGRSADWHPLKTSLVVEVQYDHFSGDRFRHGTRLLRWRTDKKPKACTIDQVTKEAKVPLTLLD